MNFTNRLGNRGSRIRAYLVRTDRATTRYLSQNSDLKIKMMADGVKEESFKVRGTLI